MINALSDFQEKFSTCCCYACKEQSCEIKLSGFPPEKFIFDVDCIHDKHPTEFEGNKCDRIIVSCSGSLIYFIPVEFKSGGVDMEHVREQLEAGVRFIKKHIRHKICCHPVLVSTRKPPRGFA